MSAKLPPGQQVLTDFPRFGLPAYARLPEIPSHAPIRVTGETIEPFTFELEELAVLPRQEQQSDHHCVQTWSARGLRWSGYRFSDFYERFIVPRLKTPSGEPYLVFRAWDGNQAMLFLEDALAADVLFADRLDGAELTIEHGAPIRLVAPAHYGYKSVKHLSQIEVCRDMPPTRRLEHPRARVAMEERGKWLPGWLLRRLYRPTIAPVRWYYRRVNRDARSRDTAAR